VQGPLKKALPTFLQFVGKYGARISPPEEDSALLWKPSIRSCRRHPQERRQFESIGYRQRKLHQGVMEAQGSCLTNNAEGYPGRRAVGGCEFMDVVETLASNRAKKLFSTEHVNVQPHSGNQQTWPYILPFFNPGSALDDGPRP
jgi:hypothetical protein